MAQHSIGLAVGPAKRKAVTDLLDKLASDLESVSLLPTERNAALEELKVYGRDPQNADPIFTEKVTPELPPCTQMLELVTDSAKGISTLLRHAFYSPSSETARAAMRVLANAMLLKPNTRQIFVDHGFAPKACHHLGNNSWDDEFLASRILFLSTYGTTVDLLDLVDNHQLADKVTDRLGHHAKLISSKSKGNSELMEEMALTETLKLLFNVTHYCNERISSFDSAVPHVVELLWKQDIPASKPLDAPSPFGPLVNALLNLDLTSSKSTSSLYPKNEPTRVTAFLIDLLDRSLKSYGDDELEVIVTPLVSLLKKIYDSAPEATKAQMREALLPTAEDRKSVLGRGDSVSSKLLKNSTHPTAPALRDAISHLLFDLSDRDASKFVENIGYGFASGFLFQNNVPIPESAAEAFSTGDATGAARPVNPITGQFMENETHPDEPELTEEEKEREAEKLFVLFERLKANGIINVQNPVEAAVQEGRYRELGDSDVEELD